MEKKKNYGAWKKVTTKGEVIEFTIEGQRYSMWENSYKKPDSKDPDYKIFPNDYKPKAETKQEYRNQQEHEEHPSDLPF